MSRQIYATSADKTKRLPFCFDSLSEAARFFGLTTGTILYHVKRGTPVNGYMLAYSNKETGKDVKDMGVEGEGYQVTYEVSDMLVCITPCPYVEEPKPKVGSAYCMRCKHFLGKDMKRKIVRCNYKTGWTKRNK